MAKAKWTVMVYMAAGDDAELDEHAIHDLQEMERARFNGDEVKVVVQIDRFWPSKPQRYEIAKGEATLVRANVGADEDFDDEEVARKAAARKAADLVAAAGEKPADKQTAANMGEGETLSNFMRWAAKHYEAEQYFLVLWGHAYGLGFGRDHGDAMMLHELQAAIALFNKKVLGGRPEHQRKLDLLGANACAMSYAEAAYELRDHVSCLVASQIAVPFAGWPYEWILNEIGKCPDPKAVGTLVVDRYVTHYAASPLDQQVAMTLLDLSQAGALKDKIAALATALHNVVSGSDVAGGASSVGHRLVHVRNAFLATPAGDVRPLIDLFDLCDELLYLAYDLGALEWAGAVPPSLAELTKAARDLRDYLTPGLTQKVGEAMESEDFRKTPLAGAAGVSKGGTSLPSVVQWLMGFAVPFALKASQSMLPDGTGTPVSESTPPLIVFHKRHSGLNGLHGLGIFAPVVTTDRDLKRLELIDRPVNDESTGKSRGMYDRLSLVKDSGWAPLVFDELRVGLPLDVVTGIEGSGATSEADRIAVTQMLASVDSVFATIDRRLVAARCTTLLGALPPDPPSRRTGRTGRWPAASKSAVNNDANPAAATTESPLGRLGRLRLMPREELTTVLQEAPNESLAAAGQAPPASDNAAGSTSSLDAGVRSLASLEKMLTDMERAVRRTLTHGTFGLGPSRLTIDLGKRDMGKRDMGKRDMGKRDMGKRDMGAPDTGKRDMGKRDMGPDIGVWVGTGTGEPSTTPAAIMADLFAQVGTDLRRLEVAVSEVELAAVRVLMGRRDVGQPGGADAKAQDRDDLERAFRIAFEVSADARRTLRRVVADPSYGLGPGAAGISTEDRSELARIGGLNGLELSLL